MRAAHPEREIALNYPGDPRADGPARREPPPPAATVPPPAGATPAPPDVPPPPGPPAPTDVRPGMTPEQVLVAATRTAAELMGLADDSGTIEPGKRADLVVLDGDPLQMAGIGDRVAAVYQQGVLVSGGV